jgi:hypothetical protein
MGMDWSLRWAVLSLGGVQGSRLRVWEGGWRFVCWREGRFRGEGGFERLVVRFVRVLGAVRTGMERT